MRLVFLLLLASLTGCATNAPKPLIGGCINWMPLYLDDHGGRLDATPNNVLISIDKQLEANLLSLIPNGADYKTRCWYRDVESGGINLNPEWGSDDGIYSFTQKDGKWVYNGKSVVVVH